MKKNLICIACPNGCHLEIDTETLDVKGNKCIKGLEFARIEITSPMRSVSSIVKTTIPNYPVICVRTNGEIPKGRILDLMKELKNIVIKEALPIGSVVIRNVFDTGVDVITTKNMD